MLAIYKRELRSYFTNMLGCAFSALLLAAAGFFSAQININSAQSRLEYSLYMLVHYCILIIFVPFLTMRSIAEERHQKTEQLLFSLPLPIWKIILAKYFAMLTVCLIPIAVLCFYPIFFSFYGTVNFVGAYASILLLVFLIAAIVAIGMFVSSLFENQIIAVIVTIGLLFVLYFLTYIANSFSSAAVTSLIAFCCVAFIFGIIVFFITKNETAAALCSGLPIVGLIAYYLSNKNVFIGAFAEVVSYLSIFDRYKVTVINGLFDITALVYYITIAAVFVFMTIQSVEKRRWN